MEVHIGSSSAVVPDSLQFIHLGSDAPTEKNKQPPTEVGTIEYTQLSAH